MLTHQQALELALHNSHMVKIAQEQAAQVTELAQKLAKANEDLKAALAKETADKEAALKKLQQAQPEPLVLPAGDDYRPSEAAA